MKLISLIAEEVHGYLKFNIYFNEQLTFLSGINGSGKTTALKLIIGLVQPSFQFLNDIRYKFAELTFLDDKTQNKYFLYKLKNDGNIEKVKEGFVELNILEKGISPENLKNSLEEISKLF